jgi:hypothetical protein
LALGTATIPFIPRKYSAVALVYPNLFTEEQGRRLPRASIDGTSFVTGELRLILSDGILAEVEKRLNLSGNADSSESLLSWVTSKIRSLFLPETRSYSAADRAIARIRNKIDVSKDPRAYVITISYVGNSAEEAANVVNAVALEYRRDKAIRRRQEAVDAAEAELRQHLAAYGDKHPKVIQAQTELEAAQAALALVGSADEALNAGNGETVKLAKPNRTPASPKGSAIMGFSLLFGWLAAGGWVLWCERRSLDPKKTLLTIVRGGLVMCAQAGARFYRDSCIWLHRLQSRSSQIGIQICSYTRAWHHDGVEAVRNKFGTSAVIVARVYSGALARFRRSHRQAPPSHVEVASIAFSKPARTEAPDDSTCLIRIPTRVNSRIGRRGRRRAPLEGSNAETDEARKV